MKKLIILLMSLTVFCGSAAARMPEREFNDSDGLFTMVEAKLPTAVMNYGYLGVDVVAGWRFCPQFALGVGAGVESVVLNSFQVPVYLHLRSDLLATRVSPYIALNIGYNFEISHLDPPNDLTGVFVAPILGVSYNVGSVRMTTGFEFRAQRATGNIGTLFGEVPGKVISLGLLGLNIGVMF